MINEGIHTAWLEIVEGSNIGKQFILGVEEQRLGRGDANEIIFSDGKISRVHASIQFQEGSFILKDLNSGNGIFVNGVRVQETLLSTGDRIRLGDTELVFYRKQSDSLKPKRSSEPKFCAYCGSSIPRQLTHCIACGAEVVAKSDEKIVSPTPVKILSHHKPTPAESVQEPLATEDGNFTDNISVPKKKPYRTLLIGLGILVSCCCIVGITFMCFMSSGSSGTGSSVSIEPTLEVPVNSNDEFPATIASEQYFEGQEAKDFAVEMMYVRDPEIIGTLRYAEELGYISVEGDEILSAARIIFDSGRVIDLFQAGASPAPDESIIFFQTALSLDEFDEAVTFFLRVEGEEDNPKLILHHPEVSVVFTEEKVEIISDLQSNEITTSPSKTGLLSINPKDGCSTSSGDEFKECAKNQTLSGWGVACTTAVISLGEAMAVAAAATAGTGGVAAPAAATGLVYHKAAVVVACGPLALKILVGCTLEARDHYPVGKITSPFKKIEGAQRGTCSNDEYSSWKIYQPLYSVDIEWSDDREPFELTGLKNYSGLSNEILPIEATDCAGHTTIVPISPPDVLKEQISERCAPDETCVIGKDKMPDCVPKEDEKVDDESPPVSDQGVEQQSLVYSGKISGEFNCNGLPYCERTTNEISLTLPPYDMAFDKLVFEGEGLVVDRAEWTEGCPVTSLSYAFTISGDFDPVAKTLNGTVTTHFTGPFFVKLEQDGEVQCVQKELDEIDATNIITGVLEDNKIIGSIGNETRIVPFEMELDGGE